MQQRTVQFFLMLIIYNKQYEVLKKVEGMHKNSKRMIGKIMKKKSHAQNFYGVVYEIL